jgi:phosphoglycerol transferase MdoB-like AlkP superfamily enzyme
VVFLSGGLPALTKVWQLTGGNLGAQVFSLQQRAQELGLWGAHFLDWGRTWRLQRQKLGEKDKERVRGFFLQRSEKLQALPAPFFGAAKGANLLLIQVESLQQFVVGLQVQGQEVTPFLNRLAKEGLYFPWVFDQTNQGRSADGEFIALNSQHALGEGAAVFRAASNRFLALPEVLRREGYHTLSAHPFERGFWNRALLHPRYGFSQSFFKRELGPGEIIGWGLADGAFFAKMVPILQRTPQPFFAFLITLGLHHPFDQFPEARKMLKLPDLGDPALENYLQAMRYFDASLQAFLQELSAKGILAHTVVALYGDHEAGIPLQEPLARLLQITWSPGRLVWLRRVPFFVLPPVAGLSGEVPEVGGQVDIAPTLLYLLGVPRPKAFVGVPLVPGWRGFAALADGSAVSSQLLWHEPTSRCQDRNTLASLPEEACRSLRQAAAQELWASRMVVLHNLLPELLP